MKNVTNGNLKRRLSAGIAMSAAYLLLAAPSAFAQDMLSSVTSALPAPLSNPIGRIKSLVTPPEPSTENITVTEPAVMPTIAAFPCELHFINGLAYIEEVVADQIGIFNPATNTITNVPVPNPLAVPGGEAIGKDGGVWFTEMTGNAIARLDPKTLQITQYPIPAPGLLGKITILGVAVSDAIEQGPDNAMWFTEIGNNAIGRIDLATHAITSYPIPTPLAGPLIIHRGPGNTMVFPESTAGKVGTIDAYTHKFVEYPVPTFASVPQGVTTGKDGTIWFTETGGNKVGAINPATGIVSEYSIAVLSNLFSPRPGPLIFGPDGNLYVEEGNLDGGSNIGVFNPVSHSYTDYPLPTPGGSACDINKDGIQGNAIYFTEFLGDKVGKITIGNPGGN